MFDQHEYLIITEYFSKFSLGLTARCHLVTAPSDPKEKIIVYSWSGRTINSYPSLLSFTRFFFSYPQQLWRSWCRTTLVQHCTLITSQHWRCLSTLGLWETPTHNRIATCSETVIWIFGLQAKLPEFNPVPKHEDLEAYVGRGVKVHAFWPST
jgi:hypothetical protein